MIATGATKTEEHSPEISDEQIRQQVRKILASPGFARAARMQRFLTFVVEFRLSATSHPDELKESVIGTAVFDREPGYDPKGDPVVRVEARRLRSKLDEFYSGPDNERPVRIEIPKGSYFPIWSWQGEPSPPAETTVVAVTAPQPIKSPSRLRRWWPALASLLLLLAGAFVLWRVYWPSSSVGSDAGEIRSLAVLPFQNLTGDPSQQYLVAGLTDEITTELAKIRNLKVISNTSAQRYRDTNQPLPSIARRLGAQAVVEGTVQRTGRGLRVSAQLIRAATDTHLWANSYLREGGDLLAVQQEIASDVAEQINKALEPSPVRVTPEAYDAFLRGRYFWNRRTSEGVRKSIDYYQRAITIDSQYARAYAALGDSYILLGGLWGSEREEDVHLARQAVNRALQLDNNLAEAHTALAALQLPDWDWAAATREYKKALDLNPNYVTAHHWYAIHLARLGKFPQAKIEIQHALDLDPLSLIINSDAAEIYEWSRDPDHATRFLQRALELDPTFAEAHLDLGKVYAQKKEWMPAQQEFAQAEQLLGRIPKVLMLEGHTYAVSGQRERALQLAEEISKQPTRQLKFPIALAIIQCGLRNTDAAMKHLDDAYRMHVAGLDIIATEPLFDGCRSDPRFQSLVKRLRLR